MSGHRITAIIVFALCTSGAFATNDTVANNQFDCDADWPCDYSTKREATFYSHEIKDYDKPSDMTPHDEKSSYGRTILHFASNSLDDPASDYQIKCSNGKWRDDHTVTSGTMVYVTGESRSFTMPDGGQTVLREEAPTLLKEILDDGLHDYVTFRGDVYLEHEFPHWENAVPKWGAIWRCENEAWWNYDNDPKDVDDLSQCPDGTDELEWQNNIENDWAAVKTLLPNGESDVAYHTVIASPGANRPCITYRCRSGYKATCKLWENCDEPLSCEPVNTSCPMPENQNMVEGQADVADCNAEYGYYAGKKYISWLKGQMNESLNNDNDVATGLYEIEEAKGQDGNLPFTCDNGGCSLKDNILRNPQCEFRCFEESIHVRLAPKKDGGRYTIECPKYFKPAFSDDGQYKYTCVFDTDAAQDAIERKQAEDAATAEQGAAQAKNTCATAICRASGGVYNNGQCKCGNYVCTTEFLVNGTPYKYCSGVERDEGTYFCVNNVLGLGLPDTHDCHKKNRSRDLLSAEACYLWKVQTAYDATKACATAALFAATGNDSAADDATDDNISELAKTLDAIENAYGLSKWRTVDGKFNYARLASDATAAVVLGTTGALVTSSVVKKKQVEAGFESLECTVGGQHVGDWGDVFRIDGK